MNKPVDLKAKASQLDEFWSPRVVGELDDSYAKVAKLKGSFTWHQHDEEDELFYILEGTLKIEFEGSAVDLKAGEMLIIPKGTLHRPIASEECTVLLIERKSTQHTGTQVGEMTKSVEDQLRPL